MFREHDFHLQTSEFSPEQWHHLVHLPAGGIINFALDSTSSTSRTGSVLNRKKGKVI